MKYKKPRNYDYLCCPKCGRHLMLHNSIYLDLGAIIACDECTTGDEFFDCYLTVKEYVEQYAYNKKGE